MFVALFFLQCTTMVTGTGSEIEARCALKGAVVYENGKPVSGARVRIRPSSYLATNPEADGFAFDTTTNENGYFHFKAVGVDSYTIEINKSGMYGKLVQLNVSAEDSLPIVLPTTTLVRTGTIKGRINLPITDDTSRPLIAIFGVEYLEKSLITQNFSFTGIPSGVYNLRLIPHAGSNLLLELHNIEVKSDSVSDVGTLNFIIQEFFNGCNSWECDSLAVRAILDANGLINVLVSSVVSIDSVTSRINGLSLADKNITLLTKDLGSLSALKSLDICKNKIVSLPNEIGYLSALSEIYADSNELRTLPYEIGYCDSLRILSLRNNNLFEFTRELSRLQLQKVDMSNNHLQTLPKEMYAMNKLQYLNLDNNDLTALPASIIKIKVKEFSIKYNRLCSVPEEIKTWISSFDSSWTITQKCE
jgi:hypothetical protein